MHIEQHIKEILRQNAYVAIPGVGSFHRVYNPAHVEIDSNTIFPPSYTILFDSQRTFDDGAVASYITNTFGASAHDAECCVQEWVSTVEARLTSKETIYFDGLGSLSNSGDSLTFAPLPKDELATIYYGLTPLPLPSKILHTKSKKNIKRKRYAIIIPVALTLACAGGYAAYQFLDWPYIISLWPWNKGSNMHTASSTPPTNASAMPITTPTKAIDSVVAPSTNQAALTLVDSTLHQRNALQPVENSITYYIVAGSFRSSENAQKQIRELLSMGFKDPKIRRENEFYQVYIAYYTSLPLAQAKLNELWNQHGEQFCFLKRVKQ